ncbi:MAG: isoprenylcysteine carboxylmethyltransferase family protein [Planctomycetota bacterium]
MLQKTFNLALGCSVLSWGIMRLVHSPPTRRWSTVNLAIVTLYFVVAWLIFGRRPIIGRVSSYGWLAGFLSLGAGALVLELAPPPDQWSTGSCIAFVSATCWVIASLVTLGKSFAVMPVYRTLVSHGPYQLVRHPAYLGEIVLLLVATWESFSIIGTVLFLVSVLFVVARITEEEKSFGRIKSSVYSNYQSVVQFRLIPYLW